MSLGDWTDSVIVNESNKFGTVYEAIASEKGLTFLNACEWDLPLCYDGVQQVLISVQLLLQKCYSYYFCCFLYCSRSCIQSFLGLTSSLAGIFR